jgi:hypothetical protein
VSIGVLLLALAACQHEAAAPGGYPDLGAAVRDLIPPDARVIGFGELHVRTDGPAVPSALAHFTTEVLPAIGAQLSDLVVETWIVDPRCGKRAEQATARVATTMRRPAETRSEIGDLAQEARAQGIQPHAMHVACDDYARIAPEGKNVDVEAMLGLTTRELGRIASEAVRHRDAEHPHRPWIAVYGGALHNDRFPATGVEEWSYAAQVDAATGGHFVEIDLIVPELALADPASRREPWFALVRAADDRVHAWRRGERSFVVVLRSARADVPR